MSNQRKTKIQEIYEKYYSDVPLATYLTLIVTDPTTPFRNNVPDKLGQYSQWFLKLYKQDALKEEDFYKAREYVTLFHDLKCKNLVPTDQRDIGKIKSLPELLQLNERIGGTGQVGKDEAYLLADRFFINNGQAICVLENDRWLVIVPKSYDASQFYACYTHWCTRFPDMYESYSKRGDLIIFINKNKINTTSTTRRLQLHFQSESFMNINDAPVKFTDFLQHEKKVHAFFVDFFKDVIDKHKFEIKQEILSLLPELREYEFRRRVENGLKVEEFEINNLTEEDREKTISLFIERFKGQLFPLYYFINSNNKQKSDYIFSIVKYNHKISDEILRIIEPILLNYFIEEKIKQKRTIEDNVLVLANDRQKTEYLNGALQKRHGEIAETAYEFLSEDQRKGYLLKRIESGSPYIADKMFFDSTSNIRNYIVSILCNKFGEGSIKHHLTKKQYNWATTDGFL